MDREEYVPETIAARLICSTVPTMRRWRYERRGPRFFRIGTNVRYKISDLEAFIAACVIETSDSRPK